MSLYPSLEDLKTSELMKAQVDAMRSSAGAPAPYPTSSLQPSAPMQTMARQTGNGGMGQAYPSLRDFMGLELSEEMIRANMPEYLLDQPSYPALGNDANNGGSGTVATRQPVAARGGIVAPVSGSLAIIKSMVTHGVRHCNVMKLPGTKLGLRVRSMNTGVFICLVIDGSPAARAGLRFGDQILQIDGKDMAGLSVKEVHGIFTKKKDGESTLLAVRDRPFERTVTLVRDSTNHIGFQFRDGKIINIVKYSSAARNGLLTDHALLEINGQNVIGLKDKEITAVINSIEGAALNVTVMPAFLYNHMVKEMDSSLFRKMDHSTMEF